MEGSFLESRHWMSFHGTDAHTKTDIESQRNPDLILFSAISKVEKLEVLGHTCQCPTGI